MARNFQDTAFSVTRSGRSRQVDVATPNTGGRPTSQAESPSPYMGSTGFLGCKLVSEKLYLTKKGVGRSTLFGAVLQRK